MGSALSKLTIRGLKSIESLEGFRLRKINVLIGANGAGKSNFVDFFRMLRALADESFQRFILEQGGGDGLLYLGPKKTPLIFAELEFGQNSYKFELAATNPGSLQVTKEFIRYANNSYTSLSNGGLESGLKSNRNAKSSYYKNSYGVAHYVYDSISNWTVYHFHDTSPLSPMRRDQSLRDWSKLRHDASNIAPYLYHLKSANENCYTFIRDTVRQIAPFFDDFLFRPQTRGAEEQLRLEWQQKGSDFPFQPTHLSDGTIRFICLATTLMQPTPPATIVIDEPELGLHPFAISMLADLIKASSQRTQVIISTQSPALLDYFEAQDVIVVNRNSGHSTFTRLDAEKLKAWLDEYSIGELWQKNVVRGGPNRE